MTDVAAADAGGIDERMKHAKAILYLQNLMGAVSQQNSQASASVQVQSEKDMAAPSIKVSPQSQVPSQGYTLSGLCIPRAHKDEYL